MTSQAFEAHPFLDPEISVNRPDILRYLYNQYLDVIRSRDKYNGFLNTLLHPAGEERLLEANLATSAYYMNEAMHYIQSLLDMVPVGPRETVEPMSQVLDCSDFQELLTLIFNATDPRLAYEARRKLYLTKLFFDVDHSWEVQRGAEHKDHVEAVLEQDLFAHVSERRTVEMCYALGNDGETIVLGADQIQPGQECWAFDLQQVEMLRDGRPVRLNVYYYSCRFKREVVPYQYRKGRELYHFAESELFPAMERRRSASIVSKMLRKGESDPRWIRDLIGVMFIVENLSELEDLKELLFDRFGGHFRVKNVVDTQLNPEDRLRLNPQSGIGYKVYKAEMDILYNSRRHPQPQPYLFTAEIQLYTLENYLRTLHSAHYANHQALKRRQFLEGLVPVLFPAQIYGDEAVRRLVEAAAPVPTVGRNGNGGGNGNGGVGGNGSNARGGSAGVGNGRGAGGSGHGASDNGHSESESGTHSSPEPTDAKGSH
ncbi:MAG: hypothetical protein H6682_18860 [Candidatus Eisenbacteria bacterium]|nr:hypothetical protein [Candidatus Eisenbacteria bacterium]